jgi:hypothetical protein
LLSEFVSGSFRIEDLGAGDFVKMECDARGKAVVSTSAARAYHRAGNVVSAERQIDSL